jgi:hypothetical protein
MLNLRSCSGTVKMAATFVVYCLGFRPGELLATVPTSKHREMEMEAQFAPWVLPARDDTPGESLNCSRQAVDVADSD